MIENREAFSPDLSSAPRFLAWGVLGGALAGLANGLNVALGGALGLGVIGVFALAALGLAWGGVAGLVFAFPFAWTRRWRTYGGISGAWIGSSGVFASWAGLAVANLTSWLWVQVACAVGVGGLLVACVTWLGRRRLFMGIGVSVWLVGLFVAAFASQRSTAVGRPANTEHPNVLLVTLEAARADRVVEQMQAVGELAQQGVWFDLAMSPSTDTQTALRAVVGLDRSPESLLSAFTHAGYETGAVIGRGSLDRDALPELARLSLIDDDQGWPLGFARTLLGQLLRRVGVWRPPETRDAGQVVARAQRFIRGRSGAWFLWVHIADPMPPWDPPPTYAARHEPEVAVDEAPLAEQHVIDPLHASRLDAVRDRRLAQAAYEGELSWVDDALQALFATVDGPHVADRTLVVFAGLQGMRLDEGEAWYGVSGAVRDSAVHVPFVLRFPSILPAGARVEDVVDLSDLPATLGSLVGFETGETLKLLPQIYGKGVARDQVAIRQADGLGGAVRVRGALIGWSEDVGWYAQAFPSEALREPWSLSRIAALMTAVPGAPQPKETSIVPLAQQLIVRPPSEAQPD